VYTVGGGEVPSARSVCLGLPDGLHDLSRLGGQPAVAVNPAKIRSGRVTFKWALSDYRKTNDYCLLLITVFTGIRERCGLVPEIAEPLSMFLDSFLTCFQY
jgi:hypothetical protein